MPSSRGLFKCLKSLQQCYQTICLQSFATVYAWILTPDRRCAIAPPKSHSISLFQSKIQNIFIFYTGILKNLIIPIVMYTCSSLSFALYLSIPFSPNIPPSPFTYPPPPYMTSIWPLSKAWICLLIPRAEFCPTHSSSIFIPNRGGGGGGARKRSRNRIWTFFTWPERWGRMPRESMYGV